MFRSSSDKSLIVPFDNSICKQIVSGNSRFHCNQCADECDENEYYSETELEIHREIIHMTPTVLNNKNTHLCLVCGKYIESNLKEHILQYHLYSSKDAIRIEREIYVCNYCKNIFFNKGMLAMHLIFCGQYIKIIKQKKIICVLCNFQIQMGSVRYHIDKIDRITTCPICLFVQPNIEHKLNHLKTHKKYLKCERCQYHSSNIQYFKEHLNTCFGDRSLKIYNNKNLNDYSIGGKTPKIFKYKVQKPSKGLNLLGMLKICIFCRHICVTNEELLDHFNLIHSDKKIQTESKLKVCSCGMEFSTAILLKHHLFKMGEDHELVEYDPNTDDFRIEVVVEPEMESENEIMEVIELNSDSSSL